MGEPPVTFWPEKWPRWSKEQKKVEIAARDEDKTRDLRRFIRRSRRKTRKIRGSFCAVYYHTGAVGENRRYADIRTLGET